MSIAIKHRRNRMSMGGRAMELEGGAATDTGLTRGAQDRGPEAKVESKALLCITYGKQKEG